MAHGLGFANTHLHYFLKLEEARNGYGLDFQTSYDFWEYTKRAHLEIATYHLCNIFDENGSADSLWRLLNDLPKTGLDEKQAKLLGDDLAFCKEKSKEPLIVKLRHWRNNFGAHRNYNLSSKDGIMHFTSVS